VNDDGVDLSAAGALLELPLRLLDQLDTLMANLVGISLRLS
jgi:hypothetical protein